MMLLRWLVCATLGASVSIGSASYAAPLEYNKDIRPILAENCFACHGPDSASRKAELRLDQRDAAIEMAAIEPGSPDESSLIERILSEDPDQVMPPPMTKKTLTAAQKETLRQWIAQGAEYQPHWSFIPPVKHQPPAVKNQAWVRNPIDAFVLAKLEAAGLEPAPEADRRTLARRLSLDLTGLPPSPEDVEAFVADTSPDAYEKLVDKFLASPHWGEHRGRYWLDAARYADTHGIHFDNFREMWSYRDWVIKAFNRNQPFDQFTIEQLAGDILPNRTLDQQIASGFNRCNMTTNEGGAINEEYLVLYNRDRTETTSQVWLGLTTGCAVCHDHKFDPISQKEFYELSAFFNNTTQNAMDGNIKDTPPITFVPMDSDRPRWDAVAAELTTVRQQLETRKQVARADFDKWVGESSAEQVAKLVPNDGLRLAAALSEGSGNMVHVSFDGQPREVNVAAGITWDAGHIANQCFKSTATSSVELADAGDIERDQPFTVGIWLKQTKAQNGAVLARMDDQHDYRGWDLWIENGRVGVHMVNKWDQDALKVLSNGTIKPNEWNHLMVTYDGSSKAAGVKVFINGDAQDMSTMVDRLQNTIRTEVPLKLAQRHTQSRLDEALLQDLRIYGRALGANEVRQVAKATRAAWLATKPADQRNEAETNELYAWWLAAVDVPTHELTGRLDGLTNEEREIRSRGTIAHVMQEKPEPAMAHVLFRGEYDKRRDQVVPSTPKALPPMKDDLPKNRIGFAQWLLQPENPLTTRVTVNRFWQEVFGTGIVRTTGDFGISGELPSHPELLDWLSIEFREKGWDVKQFFRLIVTSATYRQASIVTPAKLEKDAVNKLLSRGPRFRMDAEMVRDYALASSGLLVPKLGGPSVRPYQPEGVWEAVAMIGSNTRDYVRDSGENLYRRSMYTLWKRAAPPALMDIFNAPSREVCAVRRERTNTPLQALATLNDPQFVEAARHLAERAIKEGGESVENRFNYLAHRLVARPFKPEEVQIVQASLNELSKHYQTNVEEAKQVIAVGESKADANLDPALLASWTMLTNQLMNLDEVLNK